MLRRSLIILTVALTAATEIAWAQATDRSKQSPVFTAEEVFVISRNADLLNGLRASPWAVRDFLDKVAKVPPATGSKRLSLDDEPPTRGTVTPFDPKQNPDLERLQRASPEAVNDLFQLLKQAGTRRPSSK
jgi:hypothetical protein